MFITTKSGLRIRIRSIVTYGPASENNGGGSWFELQGDPFDQDRRIDDTPEELDALIAEARAIAVAPRPR